MSRYVCEAQENKLLAHFNEEKRFQGVPFKLCVMPNGERGTVQLIFGFDHAIGIFCQIYKIEAEKSELIADMCSMFHGLSKSHLLQIVKDFASQADEAKYNKQLQLLALDLPF
jgi:hypothetical protein